MSHAATWTAMAAAAALIAMTSSPMSAQSGAKPLVERLGYPPGSKLLIVNGDDVGMSHAVNAATFEAMEQGLMTSGTIMVPCPWFPEVVAHAKANPTRDFGLHLTHTSEWEPYRWGPVADRREVPGLISPDGYFWPTTAAVYEHAKLEELETEARAQIQRALAAGIDVTHLDSHMGVLQLRAEVYPIYLKLAREFDLPVRMASQAVMAAAGAPNLRDTFAQAGIVFPDYLVNGPRRPGEDRKAYWLRTIAGLQPGVSELFIHASKPTDEMKRMTGSLEGAGWQERAAEYELFTHDPDIRAALDKAGVTRISFRPLRDLQRRERAGRTESGAP